MTHLELPKGHVAIRVRQDEVHYDVAVPEHLAKLLVEEHGAELLTDEGLPVDDRVRVFDVVSIGKPQLSEMFTQMLDQLKTDDPFVEVPHLRKFEYADRPLLDLGPVARPEPPRPSGWTMDSTHKTARVRKRRARNKAARKARRKNRRK